MQIFAKNRLLITVLLLFTVLAAGSRALGQQRVLETPVTLRLTGVTLRSALDAIAEKAGITLSYSDSQLDLDRSVYVDATGRPLGELLHELLGNRLAGLRENGRQVTIQTADGSATVQGTVRTRDGQPAPFVTVALRGRKTQTDAEGRYTFQKVEPGNYVLGATSVGMKTRTQPVLVASGAWVEVDFTLDEDAQTLQEVQVNGEKINKYADKASEQVARLPLANLENPQVYSVVGRELISEQLVTERTDLYRNVPGAVPNFAGGGSQGMSIRGFANFNGMRNGLMTSAILPMNPAILEHVEVLKGPSGTLYGSNRGATFGGVFNYVTKQPFDAYAGEVSYTAGSYRFGRLMADINTPLNAERSALLRVNAVAQTEASFQEQGYSKNYTIAPSFLYKASDRLTFLIDAEITQSAYTGYTMVIGNLANISARSMADIPVDYKQPLLNNAIDAANGVYNLQARVTYRISEQWRSETNYLLSHGYYEHYYAPTHTLLTDSTVARTVRNQTPENFGNIQLQQNFVGDFRLGSLRNRVVVGLDYNQNYYELNRVTVPYDTVNLRRPIPNFSATALENLSAARGFVATNFVGNSWAAYASDVLNVTPELMVMASLRFDRYFTDGSYNPATGLYAGGYAQNSLSPKLGIVYQILPERLSLFANYLNGFQNMGPVTQPDNTILNLKPQYGNQWEGGIKYEARSRKLSATVSYYDIMVTNAMRNELRDNLNFTVQDGTQRSKGMEAEVLANPVPGLNVIAGYAYNQNKYEKANANVEGKFLVNSPAHMANLWVSYFLTRGKAAGLGFGAGGNYVGASWYEASNTFSLPAYTLLNASLFYDRQRYRIALKGNNLLDEHYWNTNGTPQKLANWLASLTFKF
ncbi:TonB-dependent receptor [Parapedobacter koreensis]|uniref:TonB-dependent siderophore receptor n=1 Tax=Parapedobacter koreensis TaxID=332977 RepID=A0A1H7UQV7_9SPHI|nr:TonB-dependent receptor [Parapedobacter koreensis]SEL99351.1 TonB-dependent siderophore receptor [Parapedobacter koreensis]